MSESRAPVRTTCRHVWMAVTLSALVAAQPGTLNAREQGRLLVTVVDPSDAVVPGAHVRLSPAVSAPPAPSSSNPQEIRTDGVGVASFEVTIGAPYDVRVEAPGFAPRTLTDVRARGRTTRVRVRLDIEGFVEEIVVRRDAREMASDPRGNAFRRSLGPDVIASLPDDPEALAEALRRMAGPGAVFRVDGFSTGRLPPKSAIAEIRLGISDYSAEHHEFTRALIEITTKPGVDRAQLSVTLKGTAPPLNARDFSTTGPASTARAALACRSPCRSNARRVRCSVRYPWPAARTDSPSRPSASTGPLRASPT